MIDFACKQFRIDEIIKCSLGLTKAEYKTFERLLKHKSKISTTELAEEMNLDLTTIQKTVKKLNEKGVVTRTQKNMEGGGYVYCYQLKDRQEIIRSVLATINNWTNKVETEMANWAR